MNITSTSLRDLFCTDANRRRDGFTLVEVLVSMVILLLIMGMLLGIVNQTSSVWISTNESTQQFQRAREAFDLVTSRLSQSTLNTYLDYVDASGNNRTAANASTFVPSRYVRQSELRFLSGSGSALVGGDPSIHPGQAVFFQAPGDVPLTSTANHLPGALNTWGYFVEYGSDKIYRPPFENTAGLPEHYRYRLFEMMEPSDNLSIYKSTSGSPTYTGMDWFTTPLGLGAARRRILADGVIALVLLPMLPPTDDSTGAKLAPNYTYDSTTTNADPTINPKNQLPPLVQVVMVVVDERSAAHLAWGTTPPALQMSTLFLNSSPAQRSADLNTLDQELSALKLNSRRFTVTVALRAAKWSSDQVN